MSQEQWLRRIRELYWRPDRVEHIARHDVTPEEVEEAVFADRRGLLLRVGPAERGPDETVYWFLGRTSGGWDLLVALLYIEDGIAMPLTARDMDESERRRYRG